MPTHIVITEKNHLPLCNKQDLQEVGDSHPIIKTISKEVIDLMELKKGKSLQISQTKRELCDRIEEATP
jgi:hypothetical protein